MGGDSGGTTQQTTQTTLPINQQRNVNTLLTDALKNYQSGGPQYFPGSTYAGPTADQTVGQEMQRSYLTGAGQDYVTQAQQGNAYWLDPNNIYNVDNQPGFAAAKAGVTRDVTNNLTQNILPGLNSSAVASGALGGSRNGISTGLAIGQTNQSLGDTLANMDMTAFSQNQNMFNNAQAAAPGIFALGAAPGAGLDALGAEIQGQQQAGIDDEVNRWNYNQFLPTMNLQTLQSLTGTAGTYGGTNTSQGTTQSGDGGAQTTAILGTVVMAAAIIF